MGLSGTFAETGVLARMRGALKIKRHVVVFANDALI